MKRRIIPATITIGVAILAVVLTLAAFRTPAVQVIKVNAECVVLESGSECGYTVWLNHAPDCQDCRYYDGMRVISDTDFSRMMVYWDAVDLDQPASGDCFCGSWHCYNNVGWHGDELWDTVAWRVWLPLVVVSNAR